MAAPRSPSLPCLVAKRDTGMTFAARTTMSNLTPDQIHQLGLKEVDRIGAEMLAIAHQEGFSDVLSFSESLKTNPKYVPTSAEQILDDYRKYIGQMQGKLPQLFNYLPRLTGDRRGDAALPIGDGDALSRPEPPTANGRAGWWLKPPTSRIGPS